MYRQPGPPLTSGICHNSASDPSSPRCAPQADLTSSRNGPGRRRHQPHNVSKNTVVASTDLNTYDNSERTFIVLGDLLTVKAYDKFEHL
jgi:hypothetical protein